MLGAELHPDAILFRNRSGNPYREDTLADGKFGYEGIADFAARDLVARAIRCQSGKSERNHYQAHRIALFNAQPALPAASRTAPSMRRGSFRCRR
jgi:hypothetical protein